MMRRKIVELCAVSAVLLIGVMGQAVPTTFMDGTLHNGSVTASEAGYWSSNPNSIPAGWVQETPTAYQAGGGGWTIITSNGKAVNNTGESFLPNQQYTVQADLGGFTGYPATVNVYATELPDGTGNKVLLASVSRMGNDSEGYSLFTVSNTGSGFGSAFVGYYIQVELNGSGYYDNIVVTSDIATSMTFMNATLHNGALTADAANNYWSNDPACIPAGWFQEGGNIWQAGGHWALITSLGKALNNTGELFLPNQQYTVQADLGGFDGYPATVNVYATELPDGTGNKVLLTSVSRMGHNSVEGYSLFTVSNTGPGFGSAYAGYYIQVALEGSGYYDNIVVTSHVPTSMTYMDQNVHNGAMTAWYYGTWDDPDSKSFGWESTDDPSIYTAHMMFILFGPNEAGDRVVFQNTGELVQVNHQFSVQADLGGITGATALVRVYATENPDGTGNKVLLVQVARPGNDSDGYNLFTVTRTGLATSSLVEGYYVQVVLQPIGTGNSYFDNIRVTSTEATPVISKTFMDQTLHNGALTATSAGGYWADNSYVPFDGWFAENPVSVYTTSSMFTASPPSAGTVVNNTQEMMVGNHGFTVQADLGGETGTVAGVYVYATENWDGTGNKVLLAQVTRDGNDADGFDLFTVSATGSTTAASLSGYYVQVVLKTTGGMDLNGYYDNIIVTSSLPTCGDPGHPYPDGDVNLDCYVNIDDLKILAGQWLSSGCSEPLWCQGADLDISSVVNLQDFAMLAADWLDCTDPLSPCSFNP